MAGTKKNWAPVAFRYFIFGSLVVGCLVAIFFLAGDTAKKLETLRLEARDNIQWTLAQLDVETHAFQLSYLEARANPSPENLDELRLRFDILYSRFQTISDSDLFGVIRERQDLAAKLNAGRTSLDEILPAMDGTDEMLVDAFDQIEVIANQDRQLARQLSLSAVAMYAERADTNREAIANTLLLLALFTSLLIFVLIILVTILYYLYDEVTRSATKQAAASSRLEGIIAAAPLGVVLLDKAGLVLEFNGTAEQIFGYERAEIIGRPAPNLLLEESFADYHNIKVSAYLAENDQSYIGGGTREVVAKRRNGSLFPATLSIVPSPTEADTHFVAFFIDITERKRVEAEILAARDLAQAGERAKSNLLAMVSHEIRTPLNGIIGILSLLAGTNLTDRQKEYVKMMRDSGRLLRDHVDDLLDISSIESGQVHMRPRPVILSDFLAETLEAQNGAAMEAGNRLDFKVLQKSDAMVLLDAGRVRQILFNLISNAVKFTKNGEVVVEAEVEENPVDATVEFRVIDNGTGIADADQARIFDDFVTLDPTYSRENEGTGLGLGIVRRLVTAMSGEYGVESEPGEGSVFWFRIPVKLDNTSGETVSNASESSPAEIARKKILVVEDNFINREVLKDMLEGDGHHVTLANDGNRGLEAANQQAFDLIFMDISMPGIDGVEATKQIRGGNGASRNAPIIALTAHAMPDEILRFREAGMNHCATKPIELKELRQLVSGGFRNMPLHAAVGEPLVNSEQALFSLVDSLGTEKFEEVAREFLDQGEWVRKILVSNGITTDDFAEAQMVVHKMLGSLSFLGLNALVAVLSEMDQAAKSQDRTRLMGFGREFLASWPEASDWLREKSAERGASI